MSRTLLRALEPEDLEILYQIENDQELWNVGVTNVPYSRFILRQYLASNSGDIYADGQVRLMIEDGEGRAVGIADLVNFDPRNLRAEVGIVIAVPYRRCGYAMKALSELADYARRVIHLHQLYAIVDPSNTASIALFEKAGYQKTAEMSDWLFDGHSYRSASLLQLFL